MSKNTILLVDKPAGWTSFDVVAKLRGALRASYKNRGETPTKKQLRIGHAGTLDPFATGLLIILLGDECKNASSYIKLDKSYEFTAKLGELSTTGDPEGEKKVVSDTIPTLKSVEDTLNALTGPILQRPPAYSAIKINGKRAYALARAGQAIEIPEREVIIHTLELTNYSYPYLKGKTEVSSGTYVRTLLEDIGAKLGTGAYCTELRRTTIGKYHIKDALTLEAALKTLSN
jgi:tRNA pseudouridine55 synthase